MSRITALTIFTTVISFSVASGQSIVSPEFAGVWKGHLFDLAGTDYDVRLEIKEVKKGEEGCRIEYPDRKCGGNLVFEREYIDLNDNKVAEFREQLTYGEDNCRKEGRIRISTTKEGVFQINWIRKDFISQASGSIYQ